VQCALDALAAEDAERRVAGLGDMLELGSGAVALHRGVGRHAATLDLGLVIGVGLLGREIVEGARAAGMSDTRLATTEDAAGAGKLLEERLAPGDAVLVKGSRSVGLEATVEWVKRAFTGEEG